MFVRGTAYLARRAFLIEELGEEGWNSFLEDFSKENRSFSKMILGMSQIDVKDFMRLNDGIIDRFFAGDSKTYLRFGAESAEWALRHGPYKRMLLAKDYKRFITSQPVVFRMYYSVGEAKATLDDNVVDYWVNVPASYRHVYLEYSPVGYLCRGIELTGPRILERKCIKGFSRGDSEVHYRLVLASREEP